MSDLARLAPSAMDIADQLEQALSEKAPAIGLRLDYARAIVASIRQSDSRIAQLEAEVARYKAALHYIADRPGAREGANRELLSENEVMAEIAQDTLEHGEHWLLKAEREDREYWAAQKALQEAADGTA